MIIIIIISIVVYLNYEAPIMRKFRLSAPSGPPMRAK